MALAAIHTTSNLLTNVIYDLAAYPEYIQPLRDEICAVAAEDGVLKKTSLLKLKLMDSVMKESQRTNPLSLSKLPTFFSFIHSTHKFFFLFLLKNDWLTLHNSLHEPPRP